MHREYPGHRFVGSCGDVETVYTLVLEHFSEFHTLFELKSASLGSSLFDTVPVKNRVVRSHLSPHAAHHLYWEAAAIVEATTPLVGAEVGMGGYKLGEYVPVCAVQLNPIEPTFLGPPRRVNELLDDKLDILFGHRAGHVAADLGLHH